MPSVRRGERQFGPPYRPGCKGMDTDTVENFNSGDIYEIYFWRDSHRKEIDLRKTIF